jgi:hypothetical protein
VNCPIQTNRRHHIVDYGGEPLVNSALEYIAFGPELLEEAANPTVNYIEIRLCDTCYIEYHKSGGKLTGHKPHECQEVNADYETIDLPCNCGCFLHTKNQIRSRLGPMCRIMFPNLKHTGNKDHHLRRCEEHVSMSHWYCGVVRPQGSTCEVKAREQA